MRSADGANANQRRASRSPARQPSVETTELSFSGRRAAEMAAASADANRRGAPEPVITPSRGSLVDRFFSRSAEPSPTARGPGGNNVGGGGLYASVADADDDDRRAELDPGFVDAVLRAGSEQNNVPGNERVRSASPGAAGRRSASPAGLRSEGSRQSVSDELMENPLWQTQRVAGSRVGVSPRTAGQKLEQYGESGAGAGRDLEAGEQLVRNRSPSRSPGRSPARSPAQSPGRSPRSSSGSPSLERINSAQRASARLSRYFSGEKESPMSAAAAGAVAAAGGFAAGAVVAAAVVAGHDKHERTRSSDMELQHDPTQNPRYSRFLSCCALLVCGTNWCVNILNRAVSFPCSLMLI